MKIKTILIIGFGSIGKTFKNNKEIKTRNKGESSSKTNIT